MLWKTPASKKSERDELCATAKHHLRLVAGQEGGKPALVAVTGNLMLRFRKEKVKSHRFFNQALFPALRKMSVMAPERILWRRC